jgi:UrcA family protein
MHPIRNLDTPTRTTTLLAAIALAACVCMSAHAGTGDAAGAETVKMRVQLGDLNLGTRQGYDQARARLKAAASRLCRSLADTRRVSANETMYDCINETLATYLPKLEAAASARQLASTGTASRAASAP